jgi:hypothetical protein
MIGLLQYVMYWRYRRAVRKRLEWAIRDLQ